MHLKYLFILCLKSTLAAPQLFAQLPSRSQQKLLHSIKIDTKHAAIIQFQTERLSLCAGHEQIVRAMVYGPLRAATFFIIPLDWLACSYCWMKHILFAFLTPWKKRRQRRPPHFRAVIVKIKIRPTVRHVWSRGQIPLSTVSTDGQRDLELFGCRKTGVA